jgi:hypothetical protein
MRAIWSCPVIIASITGCPQREVSEVDPVQDKVEQKDIPLVINRKIDILFVIDNSISMRDEQANLAANFPAFIEVLEQIDGGLPDVHLGVVSSDMGALDAFVTGCTSSDHGNLQTGGQPVYMAPNAPVCTVEAGGMINGNFISDVLDPVTLGRTINYSGSLADAFSCLAVGVGDSGCGFEAHLASARAALDSNPVNAGFLRDDAYLAVIVIADEDDCSAVDPNFFGGASPQLGPVDSFRCFEKAVVCDEGRDIELREVGPKTACVPDDTQPWLHQVDEFVTFLKGLKPDPRSVIVAGIIGDTEGVEVRLAIPQGGTALQPDLVPTCGMDGGPYKADPGIRLRAFFESFVDRNTFSTICDDDYTDALDQIAQLLRTVLGYPCLTGELVDKDPSTPALDPDCQFSYITRPGQVDMVDRPLPACDAGLTNQPCWHLVLDADLCEAMPTQLKVIVEDPGTPPPDTIIRGGCVVR